MEKLFNFDTSMISTITEEWLKNATSDEISLAINIGSAKVATMKSVVSSFHNSPQQNTQQNTQQIQANVSNTQIGQIGENFIESILKKHFPSVKNVASTSKSGDLSLFIDQQKIVVEVKNYTNNVPSNGVEKFQRDLATTNASGGLFISLRTPITGVTANYTLRFEYAGTKTIPCAYIVSSDEYAIVVAVNMVSQLINASTYLTTMNKDRLTSDICILSDKLDDLSRARNSMQVNIGDITNRLVKNSCEITAVEGSLRSIIDDIKTELSDEVIIYDTQFMLVELEKNNNFRKQSPIIKDKILNIIQKSYISCPKDPSGMVWKLSGNKCYSSILTFQFYVNHTDVTISKIKIPPEVISTMVLYPNINLTFTQGNVSMTLDNQTYEIIMSVC